MMLSSNIVASLFDMHVLNAGSYLEDVKLVSNVGLQNSVTKEVAFAELPLPKMVVDRVMVVITNTSMILGGPSRRYLCNPCIGSWTLTPRCFFGALARFFPKNIGLTLDLRCSAHPDCPCNATSTRHAFSGLQSFHYVQAPILARPPGCTYR